MITLNPYMTGNKMKIILFKGARKFFCEKKRRYFAKIDNMKFLLIFYINILA